MKHVLRVVSHWGLLLHIYVSMVGFTLVLLFAVTGLTLNHQDFGFGEPRLKLRQLMFRLSLLNNPQKKRWATGPVQHFQYVPRPRTTARILRRFKSRLL